MKTTIQIKTIFGKLLFEFEKENNSIKDTLIEGVKTGAYLAGADLAGADLRGADLAGAYLAGADLRGADLRGAYLTGADLRGAYLAGAYLAGAYLAGAYLRGADLRGADLAGAYLRGADLTGAYLTGAYLRGADLRGADLAGAYLAGADGESIKIKKAIVFTGLYKYVVIPFISEEDEKYIKMGCFTRKLSEWENDFWNNDNEFPNDNSEKSNLRLFAFETAKRWFNIITNE